MFSNRPGLIMGVVLFTAPSLSKEALLNTIFILIIRVVDISKLLLLLDESGLSSHVCLVPDGPSGSSHPSRLDILSSSMSFKTCKIMSKDVYFAAYSFLTWDDRNGWLGQVELLHSLISSSISGQISRSTNLA